MENYDAKFYAYINQSATQSARQLVPLLSDLLSIHSVLDVGCGQGAWLSVWQEQHAEVQGVDGSYVDLQQLLIPTRIFSGT